MTSGHDRSSKTLTVGNLIEQLSQLDPTLPVVMSQEDEPPGDCGVRSLRVEEMQRDTVYGGGPYGYDVFHEPMSRYGKKVEWWKGDRYDEPRMAVLLSKEA